MHPARLAYKSAYELWHRQIAQEGVTCHLPNNPPRRPFAAPAHVRGVAGPVPRPRYDVVFAGEWRRFGGPQKSMLEEVRALVRHGKRVAVMQMEAFRFMSKRREQLCRPVQELINAGTVDLIVPSDEVDAKLLIIRYPPVLQFAATEPSRLRAERVIILANQAPSERDGSDWRYVPKTCSRVAQEIFAVQPAWCPQGPAVRQAIAGELGAAELLPFDMPGIIDVDEWTVDRTRPRADRPVMGKHSRDNWTKWPADRDTLLRVYPDSADVDVRFMGGTRALRQVLEGDELPIGWLAYDYDEVSVRSFLCQLDFYVYFPHPTMVEAFGRAILEALACGCVVILPEQFTETFGDAAVYCTPEEVWPVVQRYYADRAMYLAQSRLAVRRVRELFGPEGYVRLVDGMITQPTAGGASLVDVGRATGVSCAAVEENDSGTEHG
jgi:glycosyltransferase involved in cell wall biosynthesis